MSRNFNIALIASVALHIFWMSAVVIINPAAMEKVKPYTSVNFLGPLLNKTAFDIMLEGIDPVISTTYAHVPIQTSHNYLRAEAPKRRLPAEELSRHNVAVSDRFLAYFLAADKSIPDFLFQTREFSDAGYRLSGDKKDRKIIYRPTPPVLIPGMYGFGDVLHIKVRSLVSREG
ncbi:MAG: hypothetical protein P9L88_00865, partial [Candidatus Tantalella remota]|nr:hypothetical protein [Candidatus Tantalella remota]